MYRKFFSFLSLCLSFAFFFFVILLYKTFPETDINAIIFHLKSGQTLLFENYVVYICQVYLIPFLIISLLTGVIINIYYPQYGKALCRLLLISSIFVLIAKYQLIDYIKNSFVKSTFYEKYYVQPDVNAIKFPSTKKNLVVLYLESIEQTYQAKEIFNDNLLPKLSLIKKEYVSFSDYYEIYGAGWTIAGLVTTNCGIPLITPLAPNMYGIQKKFLPGAVCLQDILAVHGYRQIFMIGGSKYFSCFDSFFNNRAEPHAEIIDNEFFNRKDNYWGAKDSFLYKAAQQKITELSKSHQPFSLLIMTINTHQPKGILDNQCSGNKDNFMDIVKCADYMAADFIEWLKKQPFFKNISLVVLGDHLVINNALYDKYLQPHQKKRRIFNLFINSNYTENINTNRHFSGVDIFPTVLEGIGADIPNRRLGLGVSLYDNSQQTLIEVLGKKRLDEELYKKSDRYFDFVFDTE